MMQHDFSPIRCCRDPVPARRNCGIADRNHPPLRQQQDRPKVVTCRNSFTGIKTAFGRIDKGLVNTGRCQDDVRRGRELVAERAAEIVERSRPV
jgi:hypothetical protein